MRLLEGSPNDAYSIHPAVRDGFLKGLNQTIALAGHEATQAFLTTQLSDLPGNQEHLDPQRLDFLEEIVHHSLQAGQQSVAMNLFSDRMQGTGVALFGDCQRAERVCRALADADHPAAAHCPEGVSDEDWQTLLLAWGVALFSLGQLEPARFCFEYLLTDFSDPEPVDFFLSQISALEGRLPKARAHAERLYSRSAGEGNALERLLAVTNLYVLQVWGGENPKVSPEEVHRVVDEVLKGPDHEMFVFAAVGDRTIQALMLLDSQKTAQEFCERAVSSAREVADFGDRESGRKLCLVMAELAMKRGALQEARQYEEQAVEWALARDNKAVLCAAACMAARIKLIKAEQDAVRRDDLIRGAAENVEAGLRIARPCGFALLHIDLLKTRSLVLLMQGKPTEAQHDLRVALFEGVHPHEESGFPELLAATDPKCGYAIGEAECRRRLAEALLLEAASAPEPNALVEQACEHLRLSIELFRRMNDPEVSATENLLEMARSGWRTAYPIRNMNQPAVVPPKKKQTMKPPVDFVIIAPLDEERDALLRKLKGWWKLPPSDEDIRVYFAAQLPVEFPDGSKAAYNIVVVPLADMGEQEAGNATHDAIRRWSPRFVLLVGIAGGLRKAEVGCGDVLIANQVADYELQKRTMDGTTIRWRVHPVNQQLLLASKNFLGDDWMQWINEPRPFGGTPKRRTGVICTGNKVIADGLANTYHETWERLIGVEMEAGGVAGAAFSRVNPPGFFMIRGVSDLADKDKDSTQTKSWRAYACDVAASYAMAFLTSGPVKASNG